MDNAKLFAQLFNLEFSLRTGIKVEAIFEGTVLVRNVAISWLRVLGAPLHDSEMTVPSL